MSPSLLIPVSMTPLLIADGIVVLYTFPLWTAVSLRFLLCVGYKPWASEDPKFIGEIQRSADHR